MFDDASGLCEVDLTHATCESWPDTSNFTDGQEFAECSQKDQEADWDVSMDTAVPHSQVETLELYKHISQDLVEPKRMRQLLMWCGHRALPEKGVGGQMDAAETAAMHAGEFCQRHMYRGYLADSKVPARVIQEELLNEFGTRNNLSYWYDREDTVPAVLVKKPNPRNIHNAEKLQQLEAELAR